MDILEQTMAQAFPISDNYNDDMFFSDTEASGVQYMDAESFDSSVPVQPPTIQKKKRGRPRKTVIDNTLGVVKKSKESLGKRRHFNLDLSISPNPTIQTDIPPTPHAPSKPKRSTKYNIRPIKMTAANVLYQDEVKANPEQSKSTSCRGRLFMGSSNSSEESVRTQRLFFNLGQNLYLDKQPDKTGNGEGSLRLSLWKTNAIDKMQRVGARFSITLNFDAIHQIRKEADDIKLSLSLTDNENFLGYCLALGQMIYLTVDPDICSVNLRKWYIPKITKDDPDGDLRPSREGIRLSYEQFKRLVEFLDAQLTTEFKSYDSHVFCCDKFDHEESQCSLCNVQELLPMQRQFKRLLDAAW